MIERFRIASLVLALCVAVPVKAQSPKSQTLKASNPFEAVREFSATMIGGMLGIPYEGKIYRSGDLIRVDMATEYMVTDLRTNANFTVIYKTGVCMEGSLPASRAFPFFAVRNAKILEEDRGEETVDNHPTKIEEVTIAQEGRPEFKLMVWLATDLQGFPIKMRRESMGMVGTERVVRYTDVELAPPAASLFVKPKDCGASAVPGGKPAMPANAAPAPPSKTPAPQK